MRQIQRRVHLVKDIHGSGLELQKREDQRQSDEGALAPGKFREGGFPDFAQRDADFKPVGYLLAVGRDEFGERARQEVGEDVAEVVGDFGPRFVEGLFFVLIQRADGFFDFAFVAHDGLHHGFQRGFLLLDIVDHVEDLGVDLLLHALEAFGQVPEGGARFGDVEIGEIVGGFGATEEIFVVGDPVVFGFEGGEGLRRGGLFLGGLFDGVGQALEIERFLIDAVCF